MTIAQPANVEMHRITCPYCLIGYANIEVKVTPGQMTKQIEGMNDPRRCGSCKRYFRLKPTILVVGVRMEEVK